MKFVWVAEDDEFVGCSRYRAFTVHRHLISHGHQAVCWIGFDPAHWWVTSPPTTPWTDIPGSTTIVQRIPLTQANAHHFDRVAEEAAHYGYDLDDLVWDVDAVPEGAVYDQEKSEGVAAAVEWAQFVTVSTDRLAEEVRLRWPEKTVYVVRNKIEQHVARLAQTGRALRDPSRVNIGYASGTRTHRKDFALIVPVLDRIMESRDYVDLHIIGELPLAPEFEQKWYPKYRLWKWQHVRPQLLPLTLNSLFDINLVPLEDTRFNRCKSIVKVIESGVFGIPSVVSPTGALGDIPSSVVHKARTPEEWDHYIQRLIDRPQERRSYGDSLQKYVLDHHSVLMPPDLGGLL